MPHQHQPTDANREEPATTAGPPGADRAATLEEISTVLRNAGPWPAIAHAVRQAGTVMHAELVTAGLWDKVSAADRAAVLAAVVAGKSWPGEPDGPNPETRFVAQFIAHHGDTVQHVDGLLHGSSTSPRHVDVAQAQEVARMLDGLLGGWREEAIRRTQAGTPLPQAIAWAAGNIRLARRLGLDPNVTEVSSS